MSTHNNNATPMHKGATIQQRSHKHIMKQIGNKKEINVTIKESDEQRMSK